MYDNLSIGLIFSKYRFSIGNDYNEHFKWEQGFGKETKDNFVDNKQNTLLLQNVHFTRTTNGNIAEQSNDSIIVQ